MVIKRNEAIAGNLKANKGSLNFIPLDGYCLYCKYDIVDHYGMEAIADGEFITRCPKCCMSFCE